MADFLRDDAQRLHELRVLSTYLATHADTPVGYVALLTDAVRLNQDERKKVKSGSLRLKGTDHPVVPALKVARLAVDKRYQRMGVGERLLRFSLLSALDISEMAGCRLLTLDALPHRVDYYAKRGFVYNLENSYKDKPRPSMRYDVFNPNPPPWAAFDAQSIA